MIRYPNLQLGYGTVIAGKFAFSGKGRVSIGANCRLVSPTITCEGEIVIGDHGYLHKTKLMAKQRIEIGSHAILSDCYVVDTDFHNIDPETRHSKHLDARATRSIKIGDNVWIGDKGMISKGSEIGANSVCGSNTVVRGAIPANCVCIGNPARVVKYFKSSAGKQHPEAVN